MEVATHVPDGVVCFFTSYSYMERVVQEWERAGILRQVLERKLIFIETKDVVETTLALDNFRRACDSGRGAIFLSVARGKVAEGIDFDRHYGRAVLLIGVPFQYTLSPVIRCACGFVLCVGGGGGWCLFLITSDVIDSPTTAYPPLSSPTFELQGAAGVPADQVPHQPVGLPDLRRHAAGGAVRGPRHPLQARLRAHDLRGLALQPLRQAHQAAQVDPRLHGHQPPRPLHGGRHGQGL